MSEQTPIERVNVGYDSRSFLNARTYLAMKKLVKPAKDKRESKNELAFRLGWTFWMSKDEIKEALPKLLAEEEIDIHGEVNLHSMRFSRKTEQATVYSKEIGKRILFFSHLPGDNGYAGFAYLRRK